jgi:predicted nucleic acid-binding protein
MSTYVVDPSVAAKWFFEEEFTHVALNLINKEHDLHSPVFFYLEIDSLLCKRIRRGLISEESGVSIRHAIRQFSITEHLDEDFSDSAFKIACQTRTSFYDCLYLALAIGIDASLITADKRFCNSIKKESMSKYVLWIGDLD